MLLLGIGAFAGLQAQVCSPSPIYTGIGVPGLWPNPQVSTIKDGKEGTAYSDVLTLIVPADTTLDLSALTGFPGLPTLTVSINFMEMGTPTGLPAGMGTACDPSNCQVIGGSNGCMAISGTPTESGNFTMSVPLALNVDIPSGVPVIGGGPFTTPSVPVDYPLYIEPSVGIQEDLNPNAFALGQSVPNPTEGLTTIYFTHPSAAKIEFSVFNMLGTKVYTSGVTAKTGLNTLNLDASGFTPGVYFYALNNGETTLTQRLVVTR